MKQQYLELFEYMTEVFTNGGTLDMSKVRDPEVYYDVYELVMDGVIEPIHGKHHEKYAINYFKHLHEHKIGLNRFQFLLADDTTF